ncbi:hypothetical protein ACLBXO_09820 [Methylobacterium sp. C33D]|uniref:hypothetical protein n=1 Tax=Methylobacterium mesophilicum TaxID=39956 RepID=UPI002F35EF52
MVVLTSSACSHAPLMPTAYSALPPPTAMPAAAPSTGALVDAAAPRAEADIGPLPVVIPGTLKLKDAETGQRGVNPLAALDASVRNRMTWKSLHPENLSKPAIYPGLSRMANGVDVGETSATRKDNIPGFDRELATKRIMSEYNREAAMAALLKGGRDAAKSVCSGC